MDAHLTKPSRGVLVDLFCGAGGFSLGAHQAGYQVAAAFDNDAILTSSYSSNFPSTKLVLGDLSTASGDAIRAIAQQPIEGIFGGPPCQGFSDIGRREASDPRRQLLGHFFRLVNEVQPKFFVMENVKGLAYAEAREVLDQAIAVVSDRYHICGPVIWNAADFGAATSRKRLFVIGIHKDHGEPFDAASLNEQMRPASTVSQAISDLGGASQTHLDEGGLDWWKLPEAKAASEYAAALRARDRTFSNHRIVNHKTEVAARFATVPPGGMDSVGRHPRLSWTGQCPTIRAGTGADKGSRQAVRPLHPSEHRVITVREAARLQGFPDKHIFHRATWHSFRMIGNSVCPLISRAIFASIRQSFDRTSSVSIAAE